jgi:hypothetical protein
VTSGLQQLRALVALRWTMVRSPAARRGLLALASCVPLAVLGGAVAAQVAPSALRFEATLVVPTIYLGFAVLSTVSPLTAGGGNELYPAEQLVAFPIRPETHFLTGLAVMPINLAWVSQLVVLTAATSFALRTRPAALLAVPTMLAYVVLVTALGQLGSWLVAGLRQTRHGRRAVWAAAAAAGVAAVAVVRTGNTTDVLDASPTVRVVAAMVGVTDVHAYAYWATTTGALVLLAAAALYAARAACAWALRRPGDAGAYREARAVRARAPRATPYRELLAVDRASVWRSASLRRGAFVLGLLPGLVTFALGVDWGTLLLLPGLVASGAVLLFGVNAFCLDGGGAVWLASLPHDPRLALRSKAQVVAETALVCVLLAVGAALLRVDGPPTAAEAYGLAAAVVATTVSVLGTALRLSVERPHRADLRGRRDTPAPPGTMAVYSARMAAQTTFGGLFVAGAAETGVTWLPVVAALPVLLLGIRSLAVSGRRWANAADRARVVVTVAAG